MSSGVPIGPRKLLEHANDVANHQAGAGRPRPVWLRRAVSAAYYAAFHALTLATVRHVLPHAQPDEHYQLCRSITHGRLRDVCDWVAGKPGVGKQHAQNTIARLQRHADLRQLAGIFGRLQEARHLADYDHRASFDKATTVSHVQQSARMLDTLDSLPATRISSASSLSLQCTRNCAEA